MPTPYPYPAANPLVFPESPENGDVHVHAGVTWLYHADFRIWKPKAATVTEFETDADKLLSVGMVAGDIAVITGEAERLEQFIGGRGIPIATYSGATFPMQYLGSYGAFPCFAAYAVTIGGNSRNCCLTYDLAASKWNFIVNNSAGNPVATVVSSSGGAYPLEAGWSGVSFTESDPEGNQKNWAVLRNTIQLLLNVSTAAVFVNGKSHSSGMIHDLGWVAPDRLMFGSPGYSSETYTISSVYQLSANTIAVPSYCDLATLDLEVTVVGPRQLKLPFELALRGKYHIAIAGPEIFE